MTVRVRHIKELRIQAVTCPKMDVDSLIGGMVRVETCRNCKSYAGEHGGAYIECLFDHTTLRMIEDKDGGVK